MARATTVHLGFEVGTGEPVSIPLRHLVATGQTQEAGKTTTLEALISRAGVKAVVFVTKRGESSFRNARPLRPYFREQADWQFVASILEASRMEKMRFERSWIIKASRGARTLAEVQRNVQKLMDSAKRGMDADMYLVLDAYLAEVVPQIERVEWAKSVKLAAGVNAMDLTGLNVEMQHLVIRSTIDWVLQHEENTVVVVPEAWKFIPEGRGTPVKLGAESFIRQAAALQNFLWLDSQDIAGVEKAILKSVPVWILGVQRESNEVRRTLQQIPAGIKKPTADAVATLGLGQFFVCYGTHITKVYVQPAWMEADQARAIATGELDISVIRPRAPLPFEEPKEAHVKESEARDLREENRQLRERVQELEGVLNVRRGPSEPTAADMPGLSDKLVEVTADELYPQIRARLFEDAAKDPKLLRVLVSRPAIEVQIERQVIEVDGKSLRGRIAQLVSEGFFDESAKTSGDVFKELQQRGGRDASVQISNELVELTRMGFFTRDNKWFRLVSGAKVNVVEKEPAYR